MAAGFLVSRSFSVVITDLDNTLFDWVEMWYESFTALLNALAAREGINRDALLDQIREVHQRRGTSEYFFLLSDLSMMRGGDPTAALIKYADVMRAYRAARDKALRLYPSVRSTLETLKHQGVTVVGYTESTAFYTGLRIRKLQLDGLLDVLYSPPDHSLPNEIDLSAIRSNPPEHYAYKKTIHRETPAGSLKPNPALLRQIVDELGAHPHEAIYVGDSLLKDVLMAQDAGITDVYAAYGHAQSREAYDLLRRVTHWTNEDVERERQLLQRGTVTPTHTLKRSFAELLEQFRFSRQESQIRPQLSR